MNTGLIQYCHIFHAFHSIHTFHFDHFYAKNHIIRSLQQGFFSEACYQTPTNTHEKESRFSAIDTKLIILNGIPYETFYLHSPIRKCHVFMAHSTLYYFLKLFQSFIIIQKKKIERCKKRIKPIYCHPCLINIIQTIHQHIGIMCL